MKFKICIVLLIATFSGCKNQTPKEVEKPNILFCIMDDAGIQMSAYGYDWCKTPAFDRLAENGILFTNAYTPNAKCAPSRSSILTGRNSWQLEEAANHVVNFPAKFKTFPEVLRENGWLTASTGKVWGPGDPGMIDGKKRKFIDQEFVDIKTKPWANGMSGEDYANALSPLHALLRINPNLYDVHQNLGIAYKRLGNSAKAEQHFKEAIRIQPMEPSSHFNLASLYGNIGKYIQAITEYEQADTLYKTTGKYHPPSFYSDKARAHNQAGIELGQLQNFDEAFVQFEQ